jgi:hypothetical protein
MRTPPAPRAGPGRPPGSKNKRTRGKDLKPRKRGALSAAFIARAGAGRPPGAVSRIAHDLAARLDEIGADPAMVLAHFMLDEDLPCEFRAECAGRLMPYRYSRLTSTEISAAAGMLGDVVINIVADTDAGDAESTDGVPS